MCLRRAPEKYITGAMAPVGAALDRAELFHCFNYYVAWSCLQRYSFGNTTAAVDEGFVYVISELPVSLKPCINFPNFFYFCFSHLEHKSSVKRFVSLQFLNLRQSIRLLGRGISPLYGTSNYKLKLLRND
jgi:hypothetical protein